jgi:hypothetical protein
MSLSRAGRPESVQEAENLFEALESRMSAIDAASLMYKYNRQRELQTRESQVKQFEELHKKIERNKLTLFEAKDYINLLVPPDEKDKAIYEPLIEKINKGELLLEAEVKQMKLLAPSKLRDQELKELSDIQKIVQENKRYEALVKAQKDKPLNEPDAKRLEDIKKQIDERNTQQKELVSDLYSKIRLKTNNYDALMKYEKDRQVKELAELQRPYTEKEKEEADAKLSDPTRLVEYEYHYKSQINAFYNNHPGFRQLADKIQKGESLSISDQASMDHFNEEIQLRAFRRLTAAEYTYQGMGWIKRDDPKEQELARREKTESYIRAIDLSQPVFLRHFHQGEYFVQFQEPVKAGEERGLWQGDFYTRLSESANPTDLGITSLHKKSFAAVFEKGSSDSQNPSVVKQEFYYEAKKDGVFLFSVADPTPDFWSVPGASFNTRGLGFQVYMNDKKAFGLLPPKSTLTLGISLLEEKMKLEKQIEMDMKMVEEKKSEMATMMNNIIKLNSLIKNEKITGLSFPEKRQEIISEMKQLAGIGKITDAPKQLQRMEMELKHISNNQKQIQKNIDNAKNKISGITDQIKYLNLTNKTIDDLKMARGLYVGMDFIRKRAVKRTSKTIKARLSEQKEVAELTVVYPKPIEKLKKAFFEVRRKPLPALDLKPVMDLKKEENFEKKNENPVSPSPQSPRVRRG